MRKKAKSKKDIINITFYEKGYSLTNFLQRTMSWICTLCTSHQNNPNLTICSTCGTERSHITVKNPQHNETKTTNHNSNPFNQQQPGKLPAIGLEFLSKLVRAFDYSNLAQMKVPMKNISNSISLFRPMSLWSTRQQSGQSIEGIEVWLSRCAKSSEEVRGSAVIGLQKLALASGRLTSMLRLVQTARELSNNATTTSSTPGTTDIMSKLDQKHSKLFISYLYVRVKDAARDCLFLPVINKWECDACTSLNDANIDVCGMCMSPKNMSENNPNNAANLRSKTGTSLSAPIEPLEIVTFQDLSNSILSLMSQLSSYRLGSSLSGVTIAYEPFLVQVAPATFHMFIDLLRYLILENEIRTQQMADEENTTNGKYIKSKQEENQHQFQQVLLHVITILKLNVRRLHAADTDDDLYDIQGVNKILEGIELRNLLQSDSLALAEIGAVRLELAKASGIEMVVQLMNNKSHLMAVQASGCLAMYEQVMASNDQGLAVAQAGGVKTAITAVILAHTNGHLDVLLSGMRLLSKLSHPLCYDKKSTGIDMVLLLDHILSIMKHNFRNVEIQLTSLRTIGHLSQIYAIYENSTFTTEYSSFTTEELQSLQYSCGSFLSLRATNIVPIITEALHAHVDEKDIQHEGCLLLLKLAGHSENINMMSRGGGIGAARTIIASSDTNSVIQKNGLTLLSQLMVADGFCEIIPPKDVLLCMAMFNESSMHARCMLMLHNLMRTKITKQQALAQNVLAITVASMKRFKTEKNVQKYGSLVIAECMNGQSNDYKKTFDISIASLLCLAYDSFGNESSEIGRAMLQIYLQLLQVHPSDVRLKNISNSLGSNRICSCMLKWKNVMELQHEGIWCIEYMTPVLRDEIVSANGLRAIVNAMKK